MSKTFKVLLLLVLGVPFGALCLLGFWAYFGEHDPGSLRVALTGLVVTGLTLFIVRRPARSGDELRKRHRSPKARAIVASLGILAAILLPFEIYLPLKPGFDQWWEPALCLTACVAAATWLAAINGAVVVYEDEQDLAWCAATPFAGILAALILFIGSFFYSSLADDAALYSAASLIGAIFLVSLIWSIYRSSLRHRNLFIGIVVGFVRVFLPLALSLFALLLASGLGKSKEDATEAEKISDAIFFAVVLLALYAIGCAYFRALINGDDVASFSDSSGMAPTAG